MRANAEANPQSPVQTPGVLTYTHFTTVVIAAFVPLAAGLYLLVSTSWALGERLVLRRFLPDGAPVGQDPVSLISTVIQATRSPAVPASPSSVLVCFTKRNSGLD